MNTNMKESQYMQASQYMQELQQTAQLLLAAGKGILAMDESTGTCNKRFEKVGIPTTEERRRAYRELIVTTPGLSQFISGAILYDETIRQSTRSGVPMVQVLQDNRILPGIKLDKGATPLAGHDGEKVTEGLDGLGDRIAEYYSMGARFAKWRAVITIGAHIPSRACLEANAHALARYAALCQAGGLVPIVEPEVLMDGDHTLERCKAVTEETLHEVFNQLHRQGVALDQMILKPSMVVAGADGEAAIVDQVAEATMQCLLKTVPPMVPGVAFLSGGQSHERASEHLNAINLLCQNKCPWTVTFSYARAVQQPALEYWRGDDSRVAEAQQLLLHRAKCNSAASLGQYSPEMERQSIAA
jgi:fructose-bisphosphate aldolase, class I